MVDEYGIRWFPISQYCPDCANRYRKQGDRYEQRMSLLEKHKLHEGKWLIRCTDFSLCSYSNELDQEPD